MNNIRNTFWIFLILVVVIIIPLSIRAEDNLQDLLNQYVSDLQKNPNDNALREKIIKHVQEMKPKPAVPAEAEKYEGRAEFAIKNAKTEADFLDAAKEYEKALLIAPWVSAYSFNQGIAYEKAGRFKEAKQSFEVYLVAEPDAKDAKDVHKRIAGLEFAIEKAAKESSHEAIAEKQQKKAEEFLKRLNGARYIRPFQDICSRSTLTLDIRGEEIIYGDILNWQSDPNCTNQTVGQWWEYPHGRIINKKMQGTTLILETDYGAYKTVTVTNDGNTVTMCDVRGECGDFSRER